MPAEPGKYIWCFAMGTMFLFLLTACSGFGSPDRPRHLEATALSQHHIYLTWTCDDEEYYDEWTGEYTPAVSYYIYRDGYETGDSHHLEFTDRGLDPESLYCYQVSSFWDEDLADWIFIQESAPSNEVCTWTYPLNTIRGTVSLSGAGFEGVTIQLLHNLGFPSVLWSTSTGADGSFTVEALGNDRYEVVPVMDGYTFSPERYIFNLVNESASGIDFSASPAP